MLTHNTLRRTVTITHRQNSFSLRFDIFKQPYLILLCWCDKFFRRILLHYLLSDDLKSVLAVRAAYFLKQVGRVDCGLDGGFAWSAGGGCVVVLEDRAFQV